MFMEHRNCRVKARASRDRSYIFSFYLVVEVGGTIFGWRAFTS